MLYSYARLQNSAIELAFTPPSLSGHGLLLDPVSEDIYYKILYQYCETYFGY